MCGSVPLMYRADMRDLSYMSCYCISHVWGVNEERRGTNISNDCYVRVSVQACDPRNQNQRRFDLFQIEKWSQQDFISVSIFLAFFSLFSSCWDRALLWFNGSIRLCFGLMGLCQGLCAHNLHQDSSFTLLPQSTQDHWMWSWKLLRTNHI